MGIRGALAGPSGGGGIEVVKRDSQEGRAGVELSSAWKLFLSNGLKSLKISK
jgi:hypothetical protein